MTNSIPNRNAVPRVQLCQHMLLAAHVFLTLVRALTLRL